MDKNKKHEYAKLLLNAYNNNLLKILWNTSGFSIKVDQRRKELIPELKEKSFLDYVFSIVKMVIKLAENKDITDIDENDLQTARAIFEQESDLKNHLYIKKNSKINCYKILEGQIISYRKEENPKEIEENSVIIKMILEKDDNDTSYAFEISKRDLGDMINVLIDLKDKLDSI